MITEHNTQPTIGFAAGAGRHACDDFLLQHEMHIANTIADIEQVKQQRCRDVIREVADDSQIVAERTEIEIQRVGFVDDDVRTVDELLSQCRSEVTIQFNGMQLSGERR